MPITPDIEQWLENAGYEYHCFISWAHTRNKEMTRCARIMKESIEEFLALSIPEPRVYLDEAASIGGDQWRKKVTRAICKSMAMVAVCSPIYYHPSHNWCGLEWAAMDRLSKQRLTGQDFNSIIPVLLKRGDFLPKSVLDIQYIDLSPVLLRGRAYYNTQDFRAKIMEITNRIDQIAEAIVNKKSMPDCEKFILPKQSAFQNYQPVKQHAPFRK